MTQIPLPIILILAALLEASGDAIVRKALFEHAGVARIGLFLLGVTVLAAYGTFLNLAPLEFGQVVGLYVAILFVVWQAINYFVFHQPPSWPMLVGGALIVAGGLVVSFWKSV
jgi:drug/metabolite transporter (DMT)-like permease